MIGGYKRFSIPATNLPAGSLPVRVSSTLVRIINVNTGGIVAEIEIDPETATEAGPWPLSEPQTIDHLMLWEGPRMPGVTATQTSVSVSPTGQVTFNFSGGSSIQYASWTDALSELETLDTDPASAQKASVLKAIRNSPDGSNMETMVGKSVTINYDAVQPMVIQVP